MKTATTTLSQLTVNPEINPRHQASGDDVSALEAQIIARGFTDPLWVREVENHYEIIDGSRRARALQHLFSKGQWGEDDPIAIQIFEVDDVEAREMALAGNFVRAELSPADEAVAFTRLKLSGMAEADIAVHFAASEKLVRQRIAIGTLPEVIIAALRADEINIRTAQAFTATPSAERQVEIFEKLGNGHRLNAYEVKCALEEEMIEASDGRVEFVTLEAYRAAGGCVHTDLFADEELVTDADLLINLFNEKLAETEAALKAEGWSFVEVWTNPAWNALDKWTTVKPKGTRVLSEEEQQQLEGLAQEYQRLNQRTDELNAKPEMTDEEDEEFEKAAGRMVEIEDIITALEEVPYTDAQKRKAGAIIRVMGDGKRGVEIVRGQVRHKASKAEVPDPDLSSDEEEEQDERKPVPPAELPSYSEKVTQLLLQHVQSATKLAMVGHKPALAARMGLAARIMAMAEDYSNIDAPFATRHSDVSGGENFDMVKEVTLLLFGWLTKELIDALPKDEEPPEVTFADVLAKLETLSPETITQIEAVLAASEFRVEGVGLIATRHALDLIDADMGAEGFKPDMSFLTLLSRKQVVAIITECGGTASAKWKKEDAIAAALPLIEQHGWLPKEMRTASYEGPGSNAFADKLAADLAASLTSKTEAPAAEAMQAAE